MSNARAHLGLGQTTSKKGVTASMEEEGAEASEKNKGFAGAASKDADAVQSDIIASFSSRGDALDQFNYLLELAAQLPELAESEKTDAALVSGCQSQVWLYPQWENGRFSLRGDSDTLMVRGVIRIIELMFAGKTPAEVEDCPLRFVDETELASIFDAKRKTGVASITDMIRASAKDELAREKKAGIRP